MRWAEGEVGSNMVARRPPLILWGTLALQCYPDFVPPQELVGRCGLSEGGGQDGSHWLRPLPQRGSLASPAASTPGQRQVTGWGG